MAQVYNCVNGVSCDVNYYFMPAFNPDGYEYTRMFDRLWRKNRSAARTFFNCLGTDLNRNWDSFWGSEGSSSLPCSKIYRGPSVFSAPETTAGKNAILAILADSNQELKLYITYHSYGRLIMYPWGHSQPLTSPDEAEAIIGAELYQEAVKTKNGEHYTVQKALGLYAASGTSADYVKSLDVMLCYTVELRDAGYYGFLLPVSQIIGTFEENWAGFKSLVNYTIEVTRALSLLSSCKT